ncbi:MAG TPA: universal stress protein [Casimicrobiaceae bacterium]
MTLRSMIVHLDDGPSCESRVELAARLARRLGSRLAGVYLVSTPEVAPSIAALLPPGVLERRLAAAGEAQHRAQALLGRVAAALPAADVEFRAPAGDALDAARAHARCADLAILGQPDPEDENADFSRRLAEDVMLGSGAPVLMVPYAASMAEPGTNVLIAWDGGREAARAVRDALPLLAAASRVTVVSAARGREGADAMAHAQARLRAYLAAHGIVAHVKGIEGSGSEAAERLLSQVADVGADLIVMGGYGRARAREFVLGGATRTMFESMTVPVLMSH